MVGPPRPDLLPHCSHPCFALNRPRSRPDPLGHPITIPEPQSETTARQAEAEAEAKVEATQQRHQGKANQSNGSNIEEAKQTKQSKEEHPG